MPVIHIFAVNPTLSAVVAPPASRAKSLSFRGKRADPSVAAAHVYPCPVYKKPFRTDLHFISIFKLPSNEPAEHWILRGVALLCDVK